MMADEKEIIEPQLPIKAFQLAVEYHDGQMDKAGVPYIAHLIRVALRAAMNGQSKTEINILLSMGLLHDILEDTKMTPEKLAKLIQNETVMDGVMLLTRVKGQIYFDYIDQLAYNRYATIVKLADLDDHLETCHNFELPDSLKNRYLTAKAQLLRFSHS